MSKDYGKKTTVSKIIATQQTMDAFLIFLGFAVVWFFTKYSYLTDFDTLAMLAILLVVYFLAYYAFLTTKKFLKKELDKLIFEALGQSDDQTKSIENLSKDQKESIKETLTKLKDTIGVVINLKDDLETMASNVIDGIVTDSIEEIRIPAADGRKLAWLYAHSEVLARTDEEDDIVLTVRISRPDRQQLIKMA